ncbi:MAG: HD domain-containing phosphohydrolase [Gallionella sp.]|jgi:HD-GYP domain-containing protein (c-di-GMP phosphodiesterase class II)
MAKPNDNTKLKPGEICIDASQLRPGVHVRLPGSWLEHQFLFSAFVIEDDNQARQIAALNLPQIFCDVTRCKLPPLPKRLDSAPVNPADDEEKARLDALTEKQKLEKQERIRVMKKLHERLDTTMKHYLDAAKSVGSALKSFDADPKKSIEQVNQVSQKSTEVLMSDVDSAIVLIAEKGHQDGATSHALSVMTLSLLLGKQARLPDEALRTLGVGALLHDIGKSSINSSILRNTERNKFEEAVYMTHCRAGYESASRAGGVPSPALEAILHHHERIDGSGFPDRLAGDKIHIAARVIAIANRFDNLANPMDYRRAMSPSEALSTMWVKEKNAFDNKLLQLFVRAMGVYPPGSIVQLSDGRIAAVMVSAATDNSLCPQIMIYEPEVPRHQAIIIDLAKDTSVKIDHALRLQDRSDDELDYLLPRRRMSWFHNEG